jgi:hypothetical protein
VDDPPNVFVVDQGIAVDKDVSKRDDLPEARDAFGGLRLDLR